MYQTGFSDQHGPRESVLIAPGGKTQNRDGGRGTPRLRRVTKGAAFIEALRCQRNPAKISRDAALAQRRPTALPGFISEMEVAWAIHNVMGANFQRHGTSKIDIECLISDVHRTAAQFHRLTVFVRY